MKIPTENTKEAIHARRIMIRHRLSKVSKPIKCPCLGNVPVLIEPKSIEEIEQYAGLSAESTAVALQLPQLLKTVTYYRMTLPKENNKQKKKFQFIFVYELRSETKDGKQAKLLVGVREIPLKFLQYCITARK